MIIKYSNYFKEKTVYSVLTCLAILDQEFFEFLDYNGNRYTYNSLVFYNDVIYRLKKHNNLLYDIEEIEEIKKINIEEDWDYLSNVRKSGLEILTKFNNIDKATSQDGKILIEYNNNQFTIRPTNPKKDLSNDMDSIGISVEKLYDGKFDILTQKWIDVIHKHLARNEYRTIYDKFLYEISQKNLKINWETYSTFELKGLGIKTNNMPKLYYKNFMEFNIDLAENKDAFKFYDNFKREWYNLKNDLLNNKIIKKIIEETEKNYKSFFINEYDLDNKEFYTFDKNFNLKKFPKKKDFDTGKIVSEKYYLNSKKTLTYIITFNKYYIKQLIGFESIALNNIKIINIYNER